VRVPAVILAGGSARPELAAQAGTALRALVPVAGRPMVEWVAEALAGAECVDGIVAVGSVPEAGRWRRLPDAGSFVDNVYGGLEASGPADHVLFVTCDLPFLTPESVDDFVRRALELNADVVYPVVKAADCAARFPGIRRTAVSLREGRLTGGNLMLARASFLLAQRGRIAAAYAARKSPLRLARMLGLGVLARFAASKIVGGSVLPIHALEEAASCLLGGRARALASAYPEIATDIDRAEDLRACEALARQAGPGTPPDA